MELSERFVGDVCRLMELSERFVEDVSRRLMRGEPLEVALKGYIGDSLTEEQINAIRSAESNTSQSLDKRYVGTVNFLGEIVQVFTVNGRNVRKRVTDGGQGCMEFVMGMNGYAAREPRYHATAWCLSDEVCLHNLLDPVDFLSTCVHECAEGFKGMRVVGLSYDDAHDTWGNPWEDEARHVLETEGWTWGKQPADWLKNWERLIREIAR